MGFNLDAVKGKFFDAEAAVTKILTDEKFEDELQAMLEEAVSNGYMYPRLYFGIVHRDRAHNRVEFDSAYPMIFNSYVLGEDLPNENIRKMDKAALAIKEKLESLKLKVEYRPNAVMGEEWDFEQCYENQPFKAEFIIYLDEE